MSPLSPVADKSSEPPEGGSPAGRINDVIPTSALFAAALERLNRSSTAALLQQLTKEVDAHCRALGNLQAAEAVDGQLRSELQDRLAVLRQRVEQHHCELAFLQARLQELQPQSLPTESALEERISALLSRQLDQCLGPALAAASAQLEQCAARVERKLQARERTWRRRSYLLVLLLGLLAIGGAFALGRHSGMAQQQQAQLPARRQP